MHGFGSTTVKSRRAGPLPLTNEIMAPENGASFVNANVHTAMFPSGEIRGHITRYVP